jgi:lactate dehydrogenase-like 2-hydroxyacid dehydrogenase
MENSGDYWNRENRRFAKSCWLLQILPCDPEKIRINPANRYTPTTGGYSSEFQFIARLTNKIHVQQKVFNLMMKRSPFINTARGTYTEDLIDALKMENGGVGRFCMKKRTIFFGNHITKTG